MTHIISVNEGPRPFPYDAHPASPYGTYRFTDFTKESAHLSIGRDGWAPLVYALALRQLGYGATSSLCRYLDLVGVTDAVAALEDWTTRSEEEKKAWQDRLAADAELFESIKLPWSRKSRADASLTDMLFALQPPHQGIVLACSREYAQWVNLPEHGEYWKTLMARYDWLHEQVSQEFREAGFEVVGPFFKVDAFKAVYHDEWNIYDF